MQWYLTSSAANSGGSYRCAGRPGVKPKVVFHAAAQKHVPLMEEENAWACLRNNTLGTYHVSVPRTHLAPPVTA